jgi:nucleotide-binding universal stress UspA family protein
MALPDTKPEIKLILCPIDFSEFSARAYEHALSLADRYRARLVAQHIVELWQHPSAGFAATVESYDAYCQDLGEAAKRRLQEFVKNMSTMKFSQNWWSISFNSR